MFSLEGFKEETDARRGEGTYDAVMNGMKHLNDRGVLFGVSSATSNKNVETVTSDEFVDEMIRRGAKMNWFFAFMPIGDSPVEEMDLMLDPEERIYLGDKAKEIRRENPYFTIDFFNDSPYVGGCIAGRKYFHINSKLDLEPCIFSHFATDNLKDKTLLEALNSPFFKNLRSIQPYNENLLMPCMMIDNPHVIRELVEKHHAYPTHTSAELMVTDEEFMEKLDALAEEFKPVAEAKYYALTR